MLFRTLIVVLILGIAAPLQKAQAQAAASPLATDFNLITAIDVSDSISRHEEWLQLTGLSRGVVHPGFLSLVREGLMQRIGFMAFTWSSDGQVRIVVPWTGDRRAGRCGPDRRSAPRRPAHRPLALRWQSSGAPCRRRGCRIHRRHDRYRPGRRRRHTPCRRCALPGPESRHQHPERRRRQRGFRSRHAA